MPRKRSRGGGLSDAASSYALSALIRAEREGTRRIGGGEGELGCGAVRARGLPHLTSTLSAPGRRGRKMGIAAHYADVRRSGSTLERRPRRPPK